MDIDFVKTNMTSNMTSNIFASKPTPSPTPWTDFCSNTTHLCMDNKINKQVNNTLSRQSHKAQGGRREQEGRAYHAAQRKHGRRRRRRGDGHPGQDGGGGRGGQGHHVRRSVGSAAWIVGGQEPVHVQRTVVMRCTCTSAMEARCTGAITTLLMCSGALSTQHMLVGKGVAIGTQRWDSAI